MTILVTGGCGFIGSNFILEWARQEAETVVNLDKLTYAGNLRNLEHLVTISGRYHFAKAGIEETKVVAGVLTSFGVRAVINFAAESHVDRSIHDPEAFIQTNIVGTYRLLEAVRQYWELLPPRSRQDFRFLHISTDEVYGTLGPHEPPFTEASPFRPNSPYAASKASSDHLVRSCGETYGLPVITTNCSNNYGPRQFPEKLIPLMIYKALEGEPLPVYGDGHQVRDWLHVSDHCDAIRKVLAAGRKSETYNIGGTHEMENIDVVKAICSILDVERPRSDGRSYTDQIAFVADRQGHDRRYAIDTTKVRTELGWMPRRAFSDGLRTTIMWYLDNPKWVAAVRSGEYRNSSAESR